MKQIDATFLFDPELRTIVIEGIEVYNAEKEKITREEFTKRMWNILKAYFPSSQDNYAIACNDLWTLHKQYAVPVIHEAHSSIVTGEQIMPEARYEHLIGKWVRCIESYASKINNFEERVDFTKDEYYLIDGSIENRIVVIDNGDEENPMLAGYFDLTNPRDYKPHPIDPSILEQLQKLPTDHKEFGNIREKAIENAERFGPEPNYKKSSVQNELAYALTRAFLWHKDDDSKWQKIHDLAQRGDFDPTTRIEFDYDRWKSGDKSIVRVETRDGRVVEKLTDFETKVWPIAGIISGDGCPALWNAKGEYRTATETPNDLMLIVKQDV